MHQVLHVIFVVNFKGKAVVIPVLQCANKSVKLAAYQFQKL